MDFNDEVEQMDQAYVMQQHAAQQAAQANAMQVQPQGYAPMTEQPMEVYPLALAQVDAATAASAGSFLTRQVGPLPVWGWGIATAVVGGLGYFAWKSQKSDEVEPNRASPPPAPRPSGGWEPSRSAFGEQLQRWLDNRGLGRSVKIYDTAEDAARAGLRHVSPLVTMRSSTKVPMKDLESFAKKEGLHPVEHDGGVIGFYPGRGKKGKAWEEYVDLLRDDGQKH